MGNGSDGLIVSRARDGAAIHDFEDASFSPGRSIRSLIEYASHLTVALWRAVAVVHARGLIVTRTGTDPRGETFLGGECCRGGADIAGRLRAYESARRRVHNATNGRDCLQDRYAERHLRQSHSGRAADALVGPDVRRR